MKQKLNKLTEREFLHRWSDLALQQEVINGMIQEFLTEAKRRLEVRLWKKLIKTNP
jgi:hypothetical protein